MQGRITKLYTCPECNAMTDGKSCRCGWQKEKTRKKTRFVPHCKICGAEGYTDGLCEMHWAKQCENQHIKTLEEHLKNSTGRQRIAIENSISLIKYKKLAHPVPETKQEEANDG